MTDDEFDDKRRNLDRSYDALVDTRNRYARIQKFYGTVGGESSRTMAIWETNHQMLRIEIDREIVRRVHAPGWGETDFTLRRPDYDCFMLSADAKGD